MLCNNGLYYELIHRAIVIFVFGSFHEFLPWWIRGFPAVPGHGDTLIKGSLRSLIVVGVDKLLCHQQSSRPTIPQAEDRQPILFSWFCMGKKPFPLRVDVTVESVASPSLRCVSQQNLWQVTTGAPHRWLKKSKNLGSQIVKKMAVQRVYLCLWCSWEFDFDIFDSIFNYIVYMTLGVCPNPVTVGKYYIIICIF